jgi:hypothetical protein
LISNCVLLSSGADKCFIAVNKNFPFSRVEDFKHHMEGIQKEVLDILQEKLDKAPPDGRRNIKEDFEFR